jgi:hypothetical protein
MIKLNTKKHLDTYLWKNAKLSTDISIHKKKVFMNTNIWRNTIIIIRYHVPLPIIRRQLLNSSIL